MRPTVFYGGPHTGFPLGPSSPGRPRPPAGPGVPGCPASPFSPRSPRGPCQQNHAALSCVMDTSATSLLSKTLDEAVKDSPSFQALLLLQVDQTHQALPAGQTVDHSFIIV